MSDGRCGHPGPPRLHDGAGDVDQVRRVFRGVDALLQHQVVAGALALVPQAAAGDPDERVEPGSGPQQRGRDQHQPVGAAHVRQLVPQDDGDALVGPEACRGGEQDRRTAQAPGDEQGRVGALEQPHRAGDAVVAGDAACQVVPRGLPDPGGAPGQRSQAKRTGGQRCHTDRHAREPDHDDRAAERGRPGARPRHRVGGRRHVDGRRRQRQFAAER